MPYSAKIAGHGVLGGLFNEAQGGKFSDGFINGAVGKSLSLGIEKFAPEFFNNFKLGEVGDGNFVLATLRSAIIGVVSSTVTSLAAGSFKGFARGAYTSAFQHLFNAETQAKAQEMSKQGAQLLYDTESETLYRWDNGSKGGLFGIGKRKAGWVSLGEFASGNIGIGESTQRGVIPRGRYNVFTSSGSSKHDDAYRAYTLDPIDNKPFNDRWDSSPASGRSLFRFHTWQPGWTRNHATWGCVVCSRQGYAGLNNILQNVNTGISQTITNVGGARTERHLGSLTVR